MQEIQHIELEYSGLTYIIFFTLSVILSEAKNLRTVLRLSLSTQDS